MRIPNQRRQRLPFSTIFANGGNQDDPNAGNAQNGLHGPQTTSMTSRLPAEASSESAKQSPSSVAAPEQATMPAASTPAVNTEAVANLQQTQSSISSVITASVSTMTSVASTTTKAAGSSSSTPQKPTQSVATPKVQSTAAVTPTIATSQSHVSLPKTSSVYGASASAKPSSLNVGAIIGITAAALVGVALFAIAFGFVRRRLRSEKDDMPFSRTNALMLDDDDDLGMSLDHDHVGPRLPTMIERIGARGQGPISSVSLMPAYEPSQTLDAYGNPIYPPLQQDDPHHYQSQQDAYAAADAYAHQQAFHDSANLGHGLAGAGANAAYVDYNPHQQSGYPARLSPFEQPQVAPYSPTNISGDCYLGDSPPPPMQQFNDHNDNQFGLSDVGASMRPNEPGLLPPLPPMQSFDQLPVHSPLQASYPQPQARALVPPASTGIDRSSVHDEDAYGGI